MQETSRAPVKKEKAEPVHGPVAWHPFQVLHSEIDRLFQEFGCGSPAFGRGRDRFDLAPFWAGAPTPAVDVVDKGTSLQITAELPGVDEKDLEVTLTEGVLTIKGEKSEEKEERQKNYYRSERSFGSFQRAFELPEGVDQSKIEASFQRGLLTVTLPKTETAQKSAKKIPIAAK
jgi:HSP20 family protein